jgi:hypothetical protein
MLRVGSSANEVTRGSTYRKQAGMQEYSRSIGLGQGIVPVPGETVSSDR